MENYKSAKTQIIGLILVAIVALGGVWLFNYSSDDSDNSQSTQMVVENVDAPSATVSEDGQTVSYEGVEGMSALALLKQYTTAQTEEFTGLGEYVVGINDVEADSTANYWSFYVNGEAAQVGAGDYVTKDGDQIEWRLEDVSTFDQ